MRLGPDKLTETGVKWVGTARTPRWTKGVKRSFEGGPCPVSSISIGNDYSAQQSLLWLYGMSIR